MASVQQKPCPEPHTGSVLHEKTPSRARATTTQRRLSKIRIRKDPLLPKRFAVAEDEGLAKSLRLAREAAISQGRPLSENEAIRNIEAERFEKWKSLRRAKALQSPASLRSRQRLQPYRLPRRKAAPSFCDDCRRHLCEICEKASAASSVCGDCVVKLCDNCTTAQQIEHKSESSAKRMPTPTKDEDMESCHS